MRAALPSRSCHQSAAQGPRNVSAGSDQAKSDRDRERQPRPIILYRSVWLTLLGLPISFLCREQSLSFLSKYPHRKKRPPLPSFKIKFLILRWSHTACHLWGTDDTNETLSPREFGLPLLSLSISSFLSGELLMMSCRSIAQPLRTG
jgi:hypothetical protein